MIDLSGRLSVLEGIRLPNRTVWTSAAIAAAGALAVFAAVQRPLLVIGGVFGLGFLLLSLWAPVVALGVFVTLNFLDQMLVSTAGGALTPAIKGAGGCLVLACVYRVLSRRDSLQLSPQVRLFAFASAALVIWAISAALWANDPSTAFAGAARLAQGPILVLVMIVFVRTASAIERLCYVYVGGAAFSALSGLTGLTTVTGDSASVEGRLTGGVGDPNFFAAIMMPAVLLGLFVGLAPARSRLQRSLLLAAASICLAGIFLSGSRGGVVALVVTLVVAIVFAGRWRPQILGVALVVAAVCTFMLMLVGPTDTLSRLTDFTSGGGTGRTDLWAVAEHVYRAHPLGGVGLDNFQIVSPVYTVDTNTDLPRIDLVVTKRLPVHNTYLQVAAELGTVGIALLLAILVVALAATRSAVRSATAAGRSLLELTGRGLFVGSVGMLVAFVFLTGEYEKGLWIVLGLLVAFANVARRVTDDEAGIV